VVDDSGEDGGRRGFSSSASDAKRRCETGGGGEGEGSELESSKGKRRLASGMMVVGRSSDLEMWAAYISSEAQGIRTHPL
jgi:hypothetical protein